MADELTPADERPQPPIEVYEQDLPGNVVRIDAPRLQTVERGRAYDKIVVFSDVDAQEAIHREYFLKGLISPNELSVFYGEPGCGKSFLALYMARALSKGTSILGRRVHQTNTLFMALEGVSGFEKRLKASILRDGESEGFYYISQPVNLFSDKNAHASVIKAIQGTGAGLIVIDTLNRAMAEGSENTPEDMGAFIQNMDAIRAATAVHIMIIHHSGKDSAKGMRGHSALLGAADVSVEVAKVPDSKQRTAKVLKAKDDADGDVFTFNLTVKELGLDQDGDPITTCVVEEVEPEIAFEKTPQLKPNEQLWLDTLRELFAREDRVRVVKPEPEMSPIPCATRDAVREWVKARGLVGVAHSVAKNGVLSATERSKFARMLEALKIRKKIGIHGDWIWIV